MARALRIEGAGFWYHVVCRGNGGQPVYTDKQDRESFLNRLGTVAAAVHVEIHAYALMDCHMHLFVRTREANLGRFMQRLLTGYTQWFNVRHETCGHLFQGRYKALLVDKNAYGAEVSRYIHLLPMRVGNTRKDVARLQAALRDYPWSSYRAMIGLVPKEEWLVTKDTLARWGTTVREQQTNYAGFVEQGMKGDLADPAEEAKAHSILGHDRFLDRIRRRIQKRRASDRESERTRRQLMAESIESVLNRVARAYKIRPEAMIKAGKGRGGNEARQVAMWLARDRCGAHASLHAIGTALGGIGRSAVSMACHRIARRRRRDKDLRRMLERLS